MRQHTPMQQFKEARQIATDHGMLVVEKAGTYLLFRRNPVGNIYLGKRTTAGGIRALVCRCAKFH